MKQSIKKRNIHVEGMSCSGCERRVINALSHFEGVKKVMARKSGRVYVEYDLNKLDLFKIEKILEEIDYRPRGNFLDRVKRGFYHYFEQKESA